MAEGTGIPYGQEEEYILPAHIVGLEKLSELNHSIRNALDEENSNTIRYCMCGGRLVDGITCAICEDCGAVHDLLEEEEDD